MEQKAFTLINRGMNRDLSVSKAGESSAYDNHNIRIEARDNDTLLSVTNERGNKEINLNDVILGNFVGGNVLNNHAIIFTHRIESIPPEPLMPGKDTPVDRIYRIDYDGSDFTLNLLFVGDLNLREENPIESIVYFETDKVQKIYWVDGRNVLRFMNFMAETRTIGDTELYPWQDDEGKYDTTYFDSNRIVSFGAAVSVDKDNSGSSRANGVVQYFLTYYNKHGQETGYVWASDLIYLAPDGRGGAADEANNNKVTLTFRNLDKTFSHFRIYSVFRSSVNGETVSYLVSDQRTSDESIVIDDGAHLTLQDSTRLLYLGSQPVKVGTMTHKDNTLFLGDLQSIGRDYTMLERIIRQYMFDLEGEHSFVDGKTWKSRRITFRFSDNSIADIKDTPYVLNEGNYPYKNELAFSSSEILTFKGGETYRFALRFKLADGTETDAFWIGDAKNELYPAIDIKRSSIKRIVASCELPAELVNYLKNNDEGFKFSSVQLSIAEATSADRSVKAQGVVNPTMFNTWERFNNRLYSIPSWISRPRHSDISNIHFQPVRNAISSFGEIQCNYWKSADVKTPYYQYKNYSSNPTFTEEWESAVDFQDIMIVYKVEYFLNNPALYASVAGAAIAVGLIPFLMWYSYKVTVTIITARSVDPGDTDKLRYLFDYNAMRSWQNSSRSGWRSFTKYDVPESEQDTDTHTGDEVYHFDYIEVSPDSGTAWYNHGAARSKAYNNMVDKLVNEIGINRNYIVDSEVFWDWCEDVMRHGVAYYNAAMYVPGVSGKGGYINEALNLDNASAERWQSANNYEQQVVSMFGSREPAFQKKNLMFVDENVVTLDSPELSYGTSTMDDIDCKFRLVGVAKMSSVISDYDVDITRSSVPGTMIDLESFSGNTKTRKSLNGIISWPLWRDYGLDLTEDGKKREILQDDEERPNVNRSPEDYRYGKRIIRYWLHMWQKLGSLSGYNGVNESDTAEEEFSVLRSKTFSNLHFAYSSIYFDSAYDMPLSDMRVANGVNTATYNLNVGRDNRYYNGNVQLSLTMPGAMKYPIALSKVYPTTTDQELLLNEKDVSLYSNNPVLINFRAQTHAVLSLNSEFDGDGYYTQSILPALFDSEHYDYTILRKEASSEQDETTGALLPWIDNKNGSFPAFYNPDCATPALDTCVYNENERIISLSFSSLLTQPVEAWISRITTAIDSSLDKDLYARFGYDGKYYLVRINDARVITPSDTNAVQFLLEDAKVIGVARAESTSVIYRVSYYKYTDNGTKSDGIVNYNLLTDSIVPGENEYPYIDYRTQQEVIGFNPNYADADTLVDTDRYLFIGEIYTDIDEHSRYGGISLTAISNNRFVIAGPQYVINDMPDGSNVSIYANQGDTYFQRWDGLRIKPYNKESGNNVIDITSVMLESHINLDGRTDKQRGMDKIAHIDTEQFGQLNPVYTQNNNFDVRRDLDEDFNTDSYRSSLTWTLPKSDLADVDEWTHITLASTLKLDGDKGICRALRRFQNSIIAFQDRGISEVLFNSRTQLSTNDGVPVEIGNSGKVDGKHYLTAKYGCTNKWSIVEGKQALYFVDNINKAFCAFNNGVENLSTKLGFSSWFRRNNVIEPWSPKDFKNIVSFYDRIHSDIYLMKGDNTEPCLVYNEQLGAFSSFFDYTGIGMMVNIEDRFVSFKNNKLWLQNEGLYCNFFGEQYPFWVTYRVAPEPLLDKIWTNIEFQADFFRVLDEDGSSMIGEDFDLTDLDEKDYQEWETFDEIEAWNEYQTTGVFKERPLKKFRMWRYAIPRAAINDRNIYGLDRIRNPWINLKLKKNLFRQEKQDLMQLHDVIVKYFE